MNTIEKNLYEFYRIFGRIENIKLSKTNEFESIYAADRSWPQIVFNLNQKIEPQKIITVLAKEIENKYCSPTFVAPENYISRNEVEILKINAFVPIKVITGMKLIPQKDALNNPDSECEIQDLNDETHLVDFANLIKQEFVPSEMSFNIEILPALKTFKEVQLTGLFYRKILVASMMVLTNIDVAGLYFIVTKKEYQNKGFATTLINFMVGRLYRNGIKEVVLHANHYSFGLYKKLGFTEQNRFIIYKKLWDGK